MSEKSVDNFLAHYGVLGMKWGRRGGASRRVDQVSKARAKVADARARGDIKKANADAKLEKKRVKNAIDAEKQRIANNKVTNGKSKTGPDKTTSSKPKRSLSDMSDQELRDKINRIEMERKLSALTAPKKSAGRKFVEGIMTDTSRKVISTQTAKVINNALGGAPKEGKKKDTSKKTSASSDEPKPEADKPKAKKTSKKQTKKGKDFMDDVIDVEFTEVSSEKDKYSLVPYN